MMEVAQIYCYTYIQTLSAVVVILASLRLAIK